jgi:hypothetical protein
MKWKGTERKATSISMLHHNQCSSQIELDRVDTDSMILYHTV